MTRPLLRFVDWSRASGEERRRLLARPAAENPDRQLETVRQIARRVQRDGDRALIELAREQTGVRIESVTVTDEEFDTAVDCLSPADHEALETAIEMVSRFHEAQRRAPLAVETAAGVWCEQFDRPLESVGLYVPGGAVPLPSTAIMLAVPARIAGCRRRVLCTPPRMDGRCDPAVLYAARVCDVGTVIKAGGAQAIAAMALGTESVPRVDKIFGPGNSWVMAAKRLLCGGPEGPAADLPAGPSEVMAIADDSARPEFVAADLLAQAEHGSDSQVMLVSTSLDLIRKVEAALLSQLPLHRRRQVINAALAEGRAILVPDLATAVEVANAYAPEHLIVATAQPRSLLPEIRNAGSVFLGHWTPEALGDYCSGANHVLPTHGYARTASGLSIDDFLRRMTVQEATPAGLAGLGPVAEHLAALEGLDAHAASIAVRLQRALAVA